MVIVSLLGVRVAGSIRPQRRVPRTHGVVRGCDGVVHSVATVGAVGFAIASAAVDNGPFSGTADTVGPKR